MKLYDMIKDLFLYFAKYPAKSGVKAIATMGKSSFSEYAEMLDALNELPEESVVPEIDNYVYAQTFEDIQQRIDRISGSFLFVDYGEFNLMGDGRRSFQCTQRLAVTVAMKLPDRSDMMERLIASDRTLASLVKVHARMIADADRGLLEWIDRDNLDEAELVPFVAAELHSYGWTLLLNASAPDSLGTHALARSFAKDGE